MYIAGWEGGGKGLIVYTPTKMSVVSFARTVPDCIRIC